MSSLSFGQQVLSIDESVYRDTLNHWMELKQYITFQKELDIDISITEVEKLKNWQPLTTKNIDWSSNCWLKLEVDNISETLLELVLLLHADDITFYILNKNKKWMKQLGGELRPRSKWDSHQHLPIFSSPHTIQFQIEQKTQQTIYIKLGAPDRDFSVQPKLCNRDFFLAHSNQYFNRTIASQSVFHGMLWIMLFFHLLMFAMNKDKAYLYYSAYIFCISIYLLYAFEFHYLTPLSEFPDFSRIAMMMSLFGFSLFYALFLIAFLHQNWRNDLKKILKFYIRFLLPIKVITALLLLLPSDIYKLAYSFWINFPFFILELLAFILLTWQYGRSSNRLARFIAATNLLLLGGITISFFIYFGGAMEWFDLRINTFWGILFLELSIILQLLSFALSLSYKGLETERERTRLQELDHLKSKFFANISHEFRTPLTLILGPIKQLKVTINQPQSQKQLKVAETYAQKLLKMVNQILDLSKLEAGKLKIQASIFDIINLTKMLTYSFESIASEQNIQLHFSSNLAAHQVYLDKEKFEQILTNLIANAVKYNRKGGDVHVKLHITKGNVLQLEIQDTGVGISEAVLPFIFKMYYQGNQKAYTTTSSSSGIGLAFTKELIELQKGTIYAESNLEFGTTFFITLPLPAIPKNEVTTHASPSSNILNSPPAKLMNEALTISSEHPIVLVVEDHLDIQQYIQTCLQPNYQLLFANDGKEGFEVAKKEVPDLIITDVMMPEMDGFELTKHLKEDTITSHIPIIILTGKSSKASRLEGLRTQADEYLTKPFDAEELLIRIQNLLQNRQKWISNFELKNGELIPKNKVLSLDEQFLYNVEQAVIENLSREDFTVEQLGRAVLLDRTQLFRKLKALTAQNPSQFIRTIRLNTAHKLLQEDTATVAEIAFQVGFSNTSYFSRTFKKQFGKTPGEVRNN